MLIKCLTYNLDAKDNFIRERHRQQAMYGLLKHLLRTDCVRLIQSLIARKYLAEDTVVNRNNIFASSSYIRLGERAEDVLIHNQLFRFSVSKQKKFSAMSSTTKTRKRPVKSVLENMTGVNGMINSFKNAHSNLDDSLADFIVPDDFIDDNPYENVNQDENGDFASTKPKNLKVRQTTTKTKKKDSTGKNSKYKAKQSKTSSARTNQSRYFNRKPAKKSSTTTAISQFVIDEDDYITIPD